MKDHVCNRGERYKAWEGGVLDPCLGYRGAAPSISCEDPL